MFTNICQHNLFKGLRYWMQQLAHMIVVSMAYPWLAKMARIRLNKSPPNILFKKRDWCCYVFLFAAAAVWWPIQKTPIHNAAVAQTVMFALLPGWFAVCCSCRTWQDFSDSWFWDIHLVRTWLVHCCKKTSQHFQEKVALLWIWLLAASCRSCWVKPKVNHGCFKTHWAAEICERGQRFVKQLARTWCKSRHF